MNPIKKAARIATALYVAVLLGAGQLFGSTLQEQNKATAKRAFEEILSRGRYELAEQLYAKGFRQPRPPFQRQLGGRPNCTERVARGISGRCHRA